MFSSVFSRQAIPPTSPVTDSLTVETERLARFAVFHALDPPSRLATSHTEVCLRQCVEKMLERHSMVFGGMMVRLNIDRDVDFRQGFTEVAEELFRDAVSWSKIVALFAFGARLGQHCRESPGLEDLVTEVAASLAEFAASRLTPFVREQGGWDTLCTVFPVERDVESQLWRGLLVLGLSLGLATAFLAGRKK